MISATTIDKALRAIVTPDDYEYFFSRLTSPDWIEPLIKAGFFAKPSEPIERSEGSYHPQWAPSRYLARVAAKAPALVTATFRSIEAGDNPWIHYDVIQAALRMPTQNATELARLETEWIHSQEYVTHLLVMEYTKLILKLAGEGQVDAAIGLFRSLFDPIVGESASSGSVFTWGSRVEHGWYGYAFKQLIPNLVRMVPDHLFTSLVLILETALERNGGNNAYDLSEIWRPAIEEHDQNHPHGVADTLVSALRDASVQLARQSGTQCEAIVKELERKPWNIFRRVALHVICECKLDALSLARSRLLDRDNFYSLSLKHEYVRLLKVFFGSLAEGDRLQILAWIEEGKPDLDQWADFRKKETGIEPDAEDLSNASNYWKYERLYPIGEFLPPDWQTRFARWGERYGTPKLAEFVTYFESGWGESSPKNFDELASSATEELATFLKTWLPKGGHDGPTIGGLTSKFRQVAAKEAARFSEQATLFREVPPEYICSLLEGLREALRSGVSLTWEPVVELSEWIASQPREIPGREDEDYTLRDSHPGWKWARSALASLIEEGLQNEKGQIPFRLRQRVWKVLEIVSGDPDPTPEDEENRESQLDAFTSSLNTTRGRVMHAIMRYVIWVAKHLERPNERELRLHGGMTEISEAKAVLEQHLDPTVDRSLAVRSVYGHYYPVLAAIDADWTFGLRERVFPSPDDAKQLWDAAWGGYVGYNSVYEIPAVKLLSEYERAIDRLNDPLDSANRFMPEARKRLAEHVMILYGRGLIALSPSSILMHFFAKASTDFQSHALDYVGSSLSGEREPTEAVIDRFIDLWRWLVKRAQEAEPRTPECMVLSSYGSWFSSKRFDPKWALEQLETALARSGTIEQAHFVIETLDGLVKQFPGQCLRCLSLIIESDKRGWMISGSMTEIRSILSQAKSDTNPGVANEAIRTIHELGRRGFLAFRDMLSNTSPQSSSTNP